MKNGADSGRVSKENLYVYVNGELLHRSQATISVFDHGLLYGDGIFEGIRAYSGVVFKLKEHIERLYDSANYIRLKIPLGKEAVMEAVLETLRKNNLKDAYIRLLVTRGEGDLGLNPTICKRPSIVVITEPASLSQDPRTNAIGKSTIISSIRRDPVDATSHEVKSLNYMNSILARWEAIAAGVDEAIMLDTRGFVSEATAENVFIVRKEHVATPSTDSAILHGVTRQQVIEIAEDLGYPLSEREITPFELINADEVFLTGTLAEMVPVIKVNGRVIGFGKVGNVTAKIYGEFVKMRSSPDQGVPIFPHLESAPIKSGKRVS
jgi:branched-chain amino acid aminotransferase